MRFLIAFLSTAVWLVQLAGLYAETTQPNIILVMADDMGWGQTGYRNHPVLKTPNLDAMASNGLRFERFYAGCPVCSPTRASVLTGRSNDRTGVLSHGYALRLQEKTMAQALQNAGYVTGHFGKWHLNGFKGPGAPILKTDPRNPSAFGFDEWVSVTNFFDVNPLMSKQGEFEEFSGDSSEIAISEAIEFIEKHRSSNKPIFSVVWFGSPHSPFRSLPEDKQTFDQLDEKSANHYGELVAMDRSVGKLRSYLKDAGIADNTLIVFCSDNGGLPEIEPDTVGGLRGNKATIFEGGLRVPGIIEWPIVITTPRITNYPACTMDLFPTIVDILKLPESAMIKPVDGTSLKALLTSELASRPKAIPFRFGNKLALIDNQYKLLTNDLRKGDFELYDLDTDPKESRDLSVEQVKVFIRLKKQLLDWNESVDSSFLGKDYPERVLTQPDPISVNWFETEAYRAYLAIWKNRWEYDSYLTTKTKASNKSKE